MTTDAFDASSAGADDRAGGALESLMMQIKEADYDKSTRADFCCLDSKLPSAPEAFQCTARISSGFWQPRNRTENAAKKRRERGTIAAGRA